MKTFFLVGVRYPSFHTDFKNVGTYDLSEKCTKTNFAHKNRFLELMYFFPD
jgi:hypothetical protein